MRPGPWHCHHASTFVEYARTAQGLHGAAYILVEQTSCHILCRLIYKVLRCLQSCICRTYDPKYGQVVSSLTQRNREAHMDLLPYTDTWDDSDRHANFKAEVALYTRTDPLPTLETLSRETGIPVESLVRYVLVKWASSGADALLHMGPMVLHQMEEQVERAEAADTDAARLQAYEALRQIIAWLQFGRDP